jgi:CheY-like chemotaxis protein
LRDALIRALSNQGGSGPATGTTGEPPQATRAESVPLHVLLAEDNAVNQLLAIRLLEKRGHLVKVTSNGREALDALERDAYDLVLMDVQMPEMDGIEATIALREREKITGGHQPVVALTALVIKGDKERCLAAGMDGYLSKPIRQFELDEILESCAAKSRSAKLEKEKPEVVKSDFHELHFPAEFPQTRQEVRSRFSLNETELMDRIGGDLEFLSELTEVFRREYPKQLSAARNAVVNRNGEGLNKAGHALRGALANLAAADPAALAASIELIGATGDPSTAGVLLDQLERDIKTVLISLESLCQEPAG